MSYAALARRRAANLVFPEHHESHAASAFFPSPYDSAAILTMDGVGEWATASYGIGEGNRIRLLRQLEFPHSLGLLYSAFTYYCGFRVNSGEYKLMGLAPYGNPVYADTIYQHLVDVKPDGSLWLDMSYFNYGSGLTMTGPRFHKLFGGPPRTPESEIEQRHMDLAASIQAVTEEIVMRMARHVYAETRCRNLVLAGGVALNAVANGKLLREGPYDSIWIQPAAGDAGGALGCAFFVWHQLLENPRQPVASDAQKGSFLGPAFSAPQIEQWLRERSVPFTTFDNTAELDRYVARELAAQKVVGWFQGRMEFGPRALGGRSILADPRSPRMQATVNLKVKFRESFRPFAPAVLLDQASDWFEMKAGQESPYMLLVAAVKEHRRIVPAVTHVDYSARLQTVDSARNSRFHRLLSAFHDLTGCPMLVNTSFNVRGEPMVCTPEEAYSAFLSTDLDLLVLENFVLDKVDFDQAQCLAERERRLAQFQLD